MSHDWISFVAPATAAAGTLLLLLAALHDIIARTVPNWVSVILALVGLMARIISNTLVPGLILSLAVFVIAAICWRRGWLGGGDVKLMAAATLAAPYGRAVSLFVAMSICGSILAVLYLLCGQIARARHRDGESVGKPAKLLKRTIRAEAWRLRRGGPLPYACAIAAGFIFVLF